jgi:adenylate cyclase
MDELTELEFAQRAGVSVDAVRELVSLGILDGSTFSRSDVMLARVVSMLDAKGIDAASIAAALRSGDLTLGYLESAGRRHPRSDVTLAELAAKLGTHAAGLERLFLAFGLHPPEPDERVRAEDVEALGGIGAFFGADVAEGELLTMARMWGDSARRVAAFLPHHFHTTVEEAFRRRGLGDNEAFEAAIREVGLRSGRSGEDLLTWLYRRHAETFFTEHQFEHVETALDLAGVRERTPRTVEAIVFADLSGYTRLTEEAGDAAAAQVALTLAEMVREVAVIHRGTVVKMLGDGVHLHFRDPSDAVRASVDVVRTAPERSLPPAHVGVNAGPMIYHEGDYFGRTVNIAARFAGVAGPEEIVVGEPVVRAVALDDIAFEPMPPAPLKGIAEPVPVYRVVATGSTAGSASGWTAG